MLVNIILRPMFVTFLTSLAAIAIVASKVEETSDQSRFNQKIVASRIEPRDSINSREIGLKGTFNSHTFAQTVDPLTVPVLNVRSTILVFARDAKSAYSVVSGLNGYGIPYEVVTVPKSGIELPVLNSSASTGNYGAIFVVSDVSYDYGDRVQGFQSALSSNQWSTLFEYQVNFGVRLVRVDNFPTAEFGTSTTGGCCNDGVEQLISISNTSTFPTAGLKTDAGLSTQGLWHYPATITNNSIASEFAQFTAIDGLSISSTAGVINTFPGREQMVWFIGFSTDWSATSNFLQHASIHWGANVIIAVVDDVFLQSDIYHPAGTIFQIAPSDLSQHMSWMKTVNDRLPAGSDWFIELGHNGNGNIEAAAGHNAICGTGPIEYDMQIDTPLEWSKPIGAGINLWPSTPDTFPYPKTCTNSDALSLWFSSEANLNAFAHVSHTFTHEDQNNATYFDVSREISWNKAWLDQVGIAAASRFSPKGLIPPAITGLHNGDAIKAWVDNGIVNVVGDNTRPSLMNKENEMWPLETTLEANGYEGITIVPRWATNIYYNCNLPECTVLEWKETAAGDGDFNSLLEAEKNTNVRHLLGLHHDPYMFHQANLDYGNAGLVSVNGVSQKLSLFQAWVETIIQEVTRLVTWPIISQKHDDIAQSFKARMNRDSCKPMLSWNIDRKANTITDITVTTTGNTCGAKIPVTVPGNVTDIRGSTTEMIGSDPLTIWTTMSGLAVSFSFTEPIHV
ncbi:BgTH12-04112 [Blumeria graminis f. sp. triticale]|uniref:BgTH12-04112 n=1 Tax=Blumeria graminis f. sp. triticale TaxID=1689686 RepID=A0A9W4CX49_BLUGR|nr:BgTH12-04112 [Blumeria graminis f. sp. triticale]